MIRQQAVHLLPDVLGDGVPEMPGMQLCYGVLLSLAMGVDQQLCFLLGSTPSLP